MYGIATWSYSFLKHLEAMMMSLLHLQRVTVFCIPNWPLSKDYGIFYHANMFLKKVLNVSQYRMTCSEEGFRVEFALSD